jgi:type IV secretion system protein VirD4
LLRVCADPEDLLLTLTHRSSGDRPVAVCDPYGLLPGVTPLVWDPLAGCVDSTVATRRAGAFTAATVLAAASSGGDPAAARFHAAEAAKVLQGYFHAAALTGRTLDHVMGWVADPYGDETAAKILTEHPHAESHWAVLLRGALRGSANTVALVQQAMRPFMHREVSRRCLPNYRQPATDIGDLLGRGGTIYLLGKDDAYNSVSPLFTAIAEDVLDIAERADLAGTGALMVTLDNLPSTTPIPTLPQRLARGTRRGVSIVWVAANWQQLITCYGEGDARGIRRSTDVLVLLDADAPEWVKAPAWARPAEPGEAVVLMAASPPIMTRIRRASADPSVRAEADRARAELAGHSARSPWRWDRSVAALTAARDHGLHADSKGLVTYRNFGDAGPETRI